MSPLTVDYGTQRLEAHVRWANRATLDIAVSPAGELVVTAPEGTSLEQIHAKVRLRARWVLEQQRYFAQFRPRTPERRWVPGETHRYLGRQHRIRIGDATEPAPRVRLTRGFLLVDGVSFGDSATIERVVRRWYRERAHEVVRHRIPDCIHRFDVPTEPRAVSLRTMTSRWASMSASGRLTVNPLLVRAPTSAIDYVLTHELAHLVVSGHGPRFAALLDRVMPDHRRRKELLERASA
ncbi:M48 family metallopeptidase [Microbacterium sp. BH-3-3-3]|uniref:M48 family metallopeptidase n=1 Tax=Microbacterium sp. BH-3-3-3 TaxID=1906742 RepID=UPI0011A867DE|nr:SprT family zinc-dependent metalloprotease [Microbacterium sp. BH-3-3-3]